MRLDNLIAMSRKYGEGDAYVLAGGGNTSCKQGGLMAVKASGVELGTIREAGFVFMDVDALRRMPGGEYPDGDDEREAKAIKDMMAARLPGQGDKRPSVECILHALFEQAYVLHLHPALANGMTCGARGEECAAKAFGSDSLWIPLTKPGLVLGRACKTALERHRDSAGKAASVVFLQNHGIFAAADTVDGIDAIMETVMGALAERVKRKPDMAESARGDTAEQCPGAAEASRALAALSGAAAAVSHSCNREILAYAQSAETMSPLMKPFTPDHIVYCKAAPLYAESVDGIGAAYEAFAGQRGYAPRVAVVKGLGAFGIGIGADAGVNARTADTALRVFMDAVRVAVYSESFGGPMGLDAAFMDFILNWEIESYRERKSLSGA